MINRPSLNISQALSTDTSSSRQESRNSSNHVSDSAVTSATDEGRDVLHKPILPWMRTTASLQTIVSDVHTIKRHLPEGVPVLPVKKLNRWTWHKIWLILMNSLMFCYGLIGLILGLCTYFKLYQRAIVLLIGEKILVSLVTATGVLCLSTSLVGFVGIVLNNRPLLTIYNLLMWPCFGMIAAIGYTSYRKSKWNIEGKLSYQWHYGLEADGRANIQANLHCCGYKSFSDFHETSNKCHPRTLFPGCKFKYQNLTKQALKICWIAAFSMIPVHLLVLFAGLLCSNHVNNKFGKGLPPKLYHVDYQGIFAASPLESSVNIAPSREGELHRRHT